MTRYGQIGWRMAAIAAFVGTAALAVVLTRAPADAVARFLPNSPAARARPPGSRPGSGSAVPERPAGPASGPAPPAGNTYYTLEFTNVSRPGLPPLRLPGGIGLPGQPGGRRAGGGPIGGTAVRDTSVRPKPVMLAARGDGARRAPGHVAATPSRPVRAR